MPIVPGHRHQTESGRNLRLDSFLLFDLLPAKGLYIYFKQPRQKALETPSFGSFSYCMGQSLMQEFLWSIDEICDIIKKIMEWESNMKTVVPDYYKDFHCIADKCQHTCCAGWEIDVDSATLARYEKVEGTFGERLRENIVRDDCPHFKLGAEERCPFLNEQNLCEIILNLGEENLCQICNDHPRFRNFFSDRIEVGLGLCCEAAVHLILGKHEKTALVSKNAKDEEQPEQFEKWLFNFRNRAFEIVQDRTMPIDARIEKLLQTFEVRLPQKSASKWAELFLSLERLDSAWEKELQTLYVAENIPEASHALDEFQIPFEQLLCYFIYRHLPSAQDETEAKAYLAFAVLSCQIVEKISCAKVENGIFDFETLAETVRLYSSEIEYSQENTDTLLELLWEENATYVY